VLNDWPDREATTILSRCAAAAHPHGRVVVLKGIEPDDTPSSLPIEVVLLGGKHRSVAEFSALARQAGLEVSAVARQPSGHVVVECHPTPTAATA